MGLARTSFRGAHHTTTHHNNKEEDRPISRKSDIGVGWDLLPRSPTNHNNNKRSGHLPSLLGGRSAYHKEGRYWCWLGPPSEEPTTPPQQQKELTASLPPGRKIGLSQGRPILVLAGTSFRGAHHTTTTTQRVDTCPPSRQEDRPISRKADIDAG